MPFHNKHQRQHNKRRLQRQLRQASSSRRVPLSPRDHGLPRQRPSHPNHRVTAQPGQTLKQTMLRLALRSLLRLRCSPHRYKSKLNHYQQFLLIRSQLPPSLHWLKKALLTLRILSPLHQLKNTLKTLPTHSSSRSSMTCLLSKLPRLSPPQRARFHQQFQALKLSQASPRDQICPSQAYNCQASSTKSSVQNAARTFPRLQRFGSSKAANPRRPC